MTPFRFPTLMIPHGGGPCFFMGPFPGLPANFWDGLAAHLRGLGALIGQRPKAVLMISAHWETPLPTVQAAATHRLLYDYYNFPPHTYALTYPAAGSPELAARVRSLLEDAGIPSAEESQRGLDHGVFIPLMLIYPEADIPVVQLSLRQGLSPQQHLAMGRALAPLRDEGVLIVGSGMSSYHNIRDLLSPRASEASTVFDDWLSATLESTGPARSSALAAWAEAPGGRYAHPREEHLLPVMVAAGAAEAEPGKRIYFERLGGLTSLSSYRFG